MLAYALGWGLIAYTLVRAACALLPTDRGPVWAIYAASAATIAKILGL